MLKINKIIKRGVSNFIKGQIKHNTPHFLHIINLEPKFLRHSEDINNSTIYDAYASSLCFGIITPNPIPTLCDFAIYATLGTINVSLKVNYTEIVLQEEDIKSIREFHFLVLDDVLKVLQTFLIFDNTNEAEMLLMVPIDKSTGKIDFNVINNYREVKNVLELTSEEKKNLEVTQETFLRKIVSPWYRDPSAYIVTEVSLNKVHYLHSQMKITVLIRSIFKKNMPRGKEGKRKRDKLYEEMTEHLIPEMVVKQEFPSSLWIQASFLPTILSRISYMLQLEELRIKIAREAGLGIEIVNVRKPLELDEYLLDYEVNIEDDPTENRHEEAPTVDNLIVDLLSSSLNYNKDYEAKMLEAEYPWKDLDEPKDLERDINVSIMDIEYYENFISHKVTTEDVLMKNEIIRSKGQLALTYHKDYLSDIYRALTTAKANDIVNLERLETLGDSFLKFITSIYITIRFPTYNEGRATSLKGRLVSNKNLYYLAKQKNLSGIMKYNELSPREEWLPPGFRVPEEMLSRITNKEISVTALFNLSIPREEQISGELSNEIKSEIQNEDTVPDDAEESSFGSMASFLKCQYIGDKHAADVVESLLGAYLQSCGLKGGIKFVQWIGVITSSENLEELLSHSPPNPVLNKNIGPDKIDFHLPNWAEVENILGYTFKNRAYLLQALTHSSYTPNRITLSYEKLEFVGDAILDFLITCYIYESCGNHLNPGELTDLRSALVNNNTFASFVVRCGLHKFLLMINSKLQGHIDKFVEYLKSQNYEINDEVLILLEENELNLSEYVDVPKVLGDIFEALAGAIYLDSNKDLKTVWKVFYKIMWKEIDLFSRNVPKNAVRRLFEWPGTYPKFGNALATSNDKSLVPLRFMLNGREKVVYGCGTNKVMAKKAAAKLALRSLEK
ncbi:hypothetical protein NQ317_001811 [Molorchus minor]|uniref:Dicer-2 n=1 Tax=Molorchus minor TaxID=1323400 RepID=A0ABQ9JWX0_9CUCU|nr:hypothetical protein NQ317_001811 [Molorchus minor]